MVIWAVDMSPCYTLGTLMLAYSSSSCHLHSASLSGLLAHGPLSSEPPLGHLKLGGAGFYAVPSHVIGTAPSAYLATCRLHCLIGS